MLDFGTTNVSDLSPLVNMPIHHLEFGQTKVRDISPLKGMPLQYLLLGGSPVSDLSPLDGMPLRNLNFTFKPGEIPDVLRSIKTLETINGVPAKEFLK